MIQFLPDWVSYSTDKLSDKFSSRLSTVPLNNFLINFLPDWVCPTALASAASSLAGKIRKILTVTWMEPDSWRTRYWQDHKVFTPSVSAILISLISSTCLCHCHCQQGYSLWFLLQILSYSCKSQLKQVELLQGGLVGVTLRGSTGVLLLQSL